MAIEIPPPGTSLVLDNDLFTDWRYQKAYVLQRISRYQSSLKTLPALASVTVFEALGGFENLAVKAGGLDERSKDARHHTEELIRNCTVLPFDQAAAAVAAHIFWRLSRSERNKHWRDAFLAATALAHRYGVATRNRKDFEVLAKHLPPHHPRLLVDTWKQ